MKKVLSALLCALVLAVFTIPALAADYIPPDWLVGPEIYESLTASEDEDPVPDPIPDPEPESAPEPDIPSNSEPDLPPENPPAPTAPVESAGTKTDETDNAGSASASADIPVDTGSDDKYPVGSYIDPDGQVWSPSGTLLSPDAPEAPAQDEIPVYPSDVLADTADSDPLAVDTVPPGTAYVVDMRPSDSPPAVLSGLKALVTSIFGEYTPVTTNTVVSQTIGDDTYQYLVETVAPGSAGVDYEWLAGVVLFAILLYCLMKLLGGVLR